jgi:hypothetical protein
MRAANQVEWLVLKRTTSVPSVRAISNQVYLVHCRSHVRVKRRRKKADHDTNMQITLLKQHPEAQSYRINLAKNFLYLLMPLLAIVLMQRFMLPRQTCFGRFLDMGCDELGSLLLPQAQLARLIVLLISANAQLLIGVD